MLLITSLIWGATFVAQSIGTESIGAFTFNSIRTLLGATVLFLYIIIRDKIFCKKNSNKFLNKQTILYGSLLGVILCIATNFQQFAFYYSNSGKIAFISAFYIFFVPFLGFFMKKKESFLTWLCVGLGILGLYFLCVIPGTEFSVNLGDILALVSSVFFALQILIVEKVVNETDGIKLSCIQFTVASLLSFVLMLIFENPDFNAVLQVTWPLLYSGIMSCGIGYTFQILGQKYTDATIASLLMAMESVFGVICGTLFLKEQLNKREILGCTIIFIAIIFSQLSDTITKKVKTK